jgi:arylformamidase
MPYHYVDLSHDIVDGMTTYPGLPGPRIVDYLSREDSRTHYAPGTEFHIGEITMVANTGTYLDTPAHRFRDGWDLTGLPLPRVAGVPATVITCTGRVIDRDALDGQDLAGRAVLLLTAWSRHWRTPAYSSGQHPYLTADAARIIATANAAVVGIDSINIDDTSSGERRAHTELLGAGVPIVEHLCNLDRVPDDAEFFAVPVKVSGLGTFPVRAFVRWDAS